MIETFMERYKGNGTPSRWKRESSRTSEFESQSFRTTWCHPLTVRRTAFQAENGGSIPPGTAKFFENNGRLAEWLMHKFAKLASERT